ncbi:hypothetical protein ACVWXU_000034 [Streptomyces sp. TE33382]
MDFGGASFSGGVVDFTSIDFSNGDVDFKQAEFSGSDLDFQGTVALLRWDSSKQSVFRCHQRFACATTGFLLNRSGFGRDFRLWL